MYRSIVKQGCQFLLTVLVSWLILTNLTPARAAPSSGLGWQDSGVSVAEAGPAPQYCFDPTRPVTLLVNQTSPAGTYAVNWSTSTKTKLNEHTFDTCGPNGLLYYTDPSGKTPTLRYSVDEPQGRSIAHNPIILAQDGTSQVYTLENGVLWASADGAVNWEKRSNGLGEPLLSVAAVSHNAQALYAVAGTYQPDQKLLQYTVYFSDDAGSTWEKRSNKRKATGMSLLPQVRLVAFAARTAPVDYFQLAVSNGSTGENNGETVYLSSDGGHSFSEAGQNLFLFQRVQLFYTAGGLIRLRSTESQKYTLSFSIDGGHAWQNGKLPFTPTPVPGTSPGVYLAQMANLPTNLYMGEPNGLWYSPDSGQSWQKIGANMNSLQVSPYAPLTLIGFSPSNAKLYWLDLPKAAQSITAGTVALNGGSIAFPPTGHNLWGAFKTYWQNHGGLAQFGYPKTEPFWETNASDGRAYLVQYFERNRFEYHPENAGTPYEVELGLLGSQLTETQCNTTPFQPVTDAHYPDGTFFAQTKHNLRGPFKTYWEQHGGLALYGYPISEEFQEVNVDDGKSYTVQYFERNRFEYHSENTATPYEVELGLLGNTLLKHKGWL